MHFLPAAYRCIVLPGALLPGALLLGALLLGALLLGALLLGGCITGCEPVAPPLDLASFSRSSASNTYLACPPDACAAEADRTSPAFDLPPGELAAVVRSVVSAQPRVEPVREDLDDLKLVYVQRSAVFRFPDTIYITVIPLPGNGRSALVMYSASAYGRRDFGVNAARVGDWLEKIAAAVRVP